jgi:predicted nuclease of predicted toxin-antitoxin system
VVNMRLLVDECVGPSVVRWLRENNYDAVSAFEDCRGWDDERILEKALSEGRIVVTMDKDFGEMVFRMRLPHCGIILLRCEYCSASKKISMMEKVLSLPESDLSGRFVVVTESGIRIAGQSG